MRIGIVNDKAPLVDILKKVLVSDGHEVVWIAHNGERAVEKCSNDVPDLVLMDLIMPVLDGVSATREIMKKSPCPILIVTSSVESNSSKVFEAMGAGALDVVATPKNGPDGEITGGQALLAKIVVIGKLHGTGRVREHAKPLVKERVIPPLLAIGSSTGGPSALAELLGGLPADFPAAIVIAQHVDGHFSENLALWLDSQTEIKVALARSGRSVQPGHALIAPGDQHMLIKSGGIVELTDGPGKNIYVPSVDVLFDSIRLGGFSKHSVAVLLTGMGADGARGMLDLRNIGWMTIAQDKESSVVWGMPGSAVKMGAAREVCSIGDMAGLLVRHFKKLFQELK